MPHHPLFDATPPPENRIETDPRDQAILALKLEVERLRDMGIRAELHAARVQKAADEAIAEVKTLERLLGRKVRGR